MGTGRRKREDNELEPVDLHYQRTCACIMHIGPLRATEIRVCGGALCCKQTLLGFGAHTCAHNVGLGAAGSGHIAAGLAARGTGCVVGVGEEQRRGTFFV